MATKLEGRGLEGKALVAGPLKKDRYFLRLHLAVVYRGSGIFCISPSCTRAYRGGGILKSQSPPPLIVQEMLIKVYPDPLPINNWIRIRDFFKVESVIIITLSGS